jgi:hypothetical protein
MNAEASRLMKVGIQALGSGEPDAVEQALSCFSRALDRRRQLPFETDAVARYDLAACHLNRAEALAMRAAGPRAAEALRDYDHAVALLHALPLGADPRYPRRLAIALQNRGLVLQAQGTAAAAEVVAAFSAARAVLEREVSARIPDRRHLLAVVCLNLANAHSTAGEPSWASARDAARRALALVEGEEQSDAAAAEVGLKARHTLCRVAAATALSNPRRVVASADVHDATDLVDDGLALVRSWEQKGTTRFRPVAADLLRFGAEVYARYQPQFLREFLLESADGTPSSAAAADGADLGVVARAAMRRFDRPSAEQVGR